MKYSVYRMFNTIPTTYSNNTNIQNMNSPPFTRPQSCYMEQEMSSNFRALPFPYLCLGYL